MKRRVFLLATMLFATACKGSDSGPLPGEKPKGDSSAAPQATGDVQLTGAGATFPFPLYTKWISEFARATPGVRINYQSIGSGGGIRQITERTVDFGASDAPMSDEQLPRPRASSTSPPASARWCSRTTWRASRPASSSPPRRSPGIFLGKVKAWDDPKISSENPEIKLPSKAISSVHRSDGSGTTKIFVDYLSAVSPDWKNGPGQRAPASTGPAASAPKATRESPAR
jgi:phosphate transport system substrate-binding protein